jgi:hypothetical protein
MTTKKDEAEVDDQPTAVKPAARKALATGRTAIKHLKVIAEDSEDKSILESAIAALEQSLATLEHHLQ